MIAMASSQRAKLLEGLAMGLPGAAMRIPGTWIFEAATRRGQPVSVSA